MQNVDTNRIFVRSTRNAGAITLSASLEGQAPVTATINSTDDLEMTGGFDNKNATFICTRRRCTGNSTNSSVTKDAWAAVQLLISQMTAIHTQSTLTKTLISMK